MATLINTLFPAGNTQDICLTQTALGPTNLVINGNLATAGIVSFKDLGYARQVSFTSANDLSAATFTINGTQNGKSITESLSGPNAGAVYSTLIYDTIAFISVSAAVANVSVGTGYSGYFNLIQITQSLVPNYTISLGATIGSNQISTTVYNTLDNISNNGSTFSEIISGNVSTLNTVKTVGAVSYYVYPVPPINTVPATNQLLIALTGSTSTISNSTRLIFRQPV